MSGLWANKFLRLRVGGRSGCSFFLDEQAMLLWRQVFFGDFNAAKDGCDHRLGQSLEEALRLTRRRWRSRWADAVR